MRLLLVEDDQLLGESISTSLTRQGYTVDWLQLGAGVETTLIGKMSDQAQLSGLLNSLYELHMSVLSVEKLNNKI